YELATSVNFLENRITGDVPWQQVGRELNSLRLKAESLGEHADQFCFSQARQTLQQKVPPSEQPGDYEVNQRFLPIYGSIKSLPKRADMGRDLLNLNLRGVI